MSKKIATIIGASGFIGQALAKHLANQGWQCVLAGKDFNWERSPKNLGYVYYCAGLTSDYLNRPRDTIEAHVVLLTKILCDYQYDSLTYLSSTRLYDGLLQNKFANVFDENTGLILNPNNPRNIFDISKALGESVCKVLGNGRARVARLSCVYRDMNDMDGFLPDLMRRVLDAKKTNNNSIILKVNTRLNYFRDYVALDDVLIALQLIAENGQRLIYNVASGENISNHQLFKAIEGLVNVRCEAELPDDLKIETANDISISAMRNDFSWAPIGVLDRISEIFKREIEYAV